MCYCVDASVIKLLYHHTAVGADAKAKAAPLLTGKTANLPAVFRVLASAGVAAALNTTIDTYVVSTACTSRHSVAAATFMRRLTAVLPCMRMLYIIALTACTDYVSDVLDSCVSASTRLQCGTFCILSLERT